MEAHEFYRDDRRVIVGPFASDGGDTTLRLVIGGREVTESLYCRAEEVPTNCIAKVRSIGLEPSQVRIFGKCVLPLAAIAAIDSLRDAVAAEKAAILAKHCPGMEVLRAAYAEHARYRQEFSAMMDDEYNDGVRPPKPATSDLAALRAQYPAAALYIAACDQADCSAHWAKAKAGGEAKAMLLAGADLAAVRAKLDNWLSDNKVEVD